MQNVHALPSKLVSSYLPSEYLHEVLLVGSHDEAPSLSLSAAVVRLQLGTDQQFSPRQHAERRNNSKIAEEHTLKNNRSLSSLQAQSASHSVLRCSIKP